MEAFKIIKDLSYDFNLDLHDENIMRRKPKQLVIIDPFMSNI